jgi:hypothetical protein
MQGRRRALGNIQFVGQLYKQSMLTEKIMHECIKMLLEDVPPPPFLHALGVLMTSIRMTYSCMSTVMTLL